MKEFKLLLTAIVIIIATISCALSTDELATEVQKSMEEKLEPQGITIKSFTLTHKGGNEYHGVLESKNHWGENTNIVKVIYDGQKLDMGNRRANYSCRYFSSAMEGYL